MPWQIVWTRTRAQTLIPYLDSVCEWTHVQALTDAAIKTLAHVGTRAEDRESLALVNTDSSHSLILQSVGKQHSFELEIGNSHGSHLLVSDQHPLSDLFRGQPELPPSQ